VHRGEELLALADRHGELTHPTSSLDSLASYESG